MYNLIFHHGWGFDKEFFHHVIEFFEKQKGFKCYSFDKGYFGKRQVPVIENQGINIGIGHSIGFWHLLNQEIEFKALISISGFAKFLKKKQDDKALKAMIEKFKTQPNEVLQDFYANCFDDVSKAPMINNPNYKLLSMDLKSLLHEDMTPIVKKIKVPFLAMHGFSDKIIEESDISYAYISGGHGIGLESHESICELILDLLKESFDESL